VFVYVGGLLWVDFVNTEVMDGASIRELLTSPADVTHWLSGLEATVLADERLTGAELEQLRELRALLRACAYETTAAGAVPASFVERLNERLQRLPGVWQVEVAATGRQPQFRPQGGMLAQVSWLVLQSAVEFVCTGHVARLKRCGNQACIRYYYDHSKNNARRWCRMETCGNREKARRHYQRKTVGDVKEEG